MKRRQFIISVGSATAVGSGLARLGNAATPCPPSPIEVNGGTTSTTQCATSSPGTMPKWLQGKGVYEWVALTSPESNPSMFPNPLPAGFGVGAVTDAWSGAALRNNGSYLLLHGGGHVDYAGNDIYAMRLEDDVPTWQRVWGPKINVDGSPIGTNPGAIHTYGRLQYDQQRDILMRFGDGRYPIGGVGPGVYGWTWGAADWAQYQAHPKIGSSFYETMGYTTDPVSGNVYGPNSVYRFVWDHATQTFKAPITQSQDIGENGFAFDTARGCVWAICQKIAGKMLKWNVSNNTETIVALTGSGAAAIGADAYQGIQYDPVADRLFVYLQSGKLYSINPATLTVTTVTTAGAAPAALPSDTKYGINNKLQYVPKLGGLVLQTRWSAPTAFIRTH